MLEVKNRDRSFRKLAKTVILLPLLTACSAEGSGLNSMQQNGIVSGYGEKSFTERYDLSLTLPISESRFVNILRKHKLKFSICGDIEKGDPLPPTRESSDSNLKDVIRCYEIYGDKDEVRQMSEAWRAFVDKNHNVIYIENAFSYTGL